MFRKHCEEVHGIRKNIKGNLTESRESEESSVKT